jgi:hypothetical protein
VEPPERATAGFGALLSLSFARAVREQLRGRQALLFDCTLVVVFSVFVSTVFLQLDLLTPGPPTEAYNGCQPAIKSACAKALTGVGDGILPRAVMVAMSMSLAAGAISIRTFGTERVVYWREAASLSQPMHSIAHFIGKDLAAVPAVLVLPFLYTFCFVLITQPRATFGCYYLLFVALYYTASSFGYLVSVVLPPALAQLGAVVCIFSSTLFAGGGPTLPQLRAMTPPLNLLPSASFIRYGLEALYVVEVAEWNDVAWKIEGSSLASYVADTYGYELGVYGFNVGMVFVYGVAMRIVSLALLVACDKNKKL